MHTRHTLSAVALGTVLVGSGLVTQAQAAPTQAPGAPTSAAARCWTPNQQSGGTYVTPKDGESVVYHNGPAACPGGTAWTSLVNLACKYKNPAGNWWFYARGIGWVHHKHLSMVGSDWPARTCAS